MTTTGAHDDAARHPSGPAAATPTWWQPTLGAGVAVDLPVVAEPLAPGGGNGAVDTGVPESDVEAADELVDEEPLDEEPLDEEPLDEEPLAEEPLDEEPLAEEPLDEDLLAEEVADEPVDAVLEEPADEVEAPVKEEEGDTGAPGEGAAWSADPQEQAAEDPAPDDAVLVDGASIRARVEPAPPPGSSALRPATPEPAVVYETAGAVGGRIRAALGLLLVVLVSAATLAALVGLLVLAIGVALTQTAG